MKTFIRSHVLISCLALLLASGLCFWALEKNSCFEVIIYKEIRIRAGSCSSDSV